MDVRLDPMTEPMRCAHGREFIVFGDTVEWLTIPCDLVCEADSGRGRRVSLG
jgi:hypothetical protein